MTTMTTAKTIRSRTRAARRRRGFAFTEVLFAVMVLGLGFIMIAAMFPVTIRQTQSTLEETVGANVARGAVEYLQGVASEDLFPPTVPPNTTTGTVPPPPLYGQLAEFVSLQDAKPYTAQVVGQSPLSWGTPYDATNPKNNQFWPAYNTVKGNMIDPTDPRLAWVAFYRRELNSPLAQVVVIALRCRERDRYVGTMGPYYTSPSGTGTMYSDLDRPYKPAAPNQMAATLEPVKVEVALQYVGSQSHGTVTLRDSSGSGVLLGRAATGAYLVIATDPVAHPAPNRPGQLIGRVFQLGNPIDEGALTPPSPTKTSKWELSPAGDMIRSDSTKDNPLVASDDPNCDFSTTGKPEDGVQAYIIGRGYRDPSDGNQGFAGPAQDIAVYTGFIAIPPRPTN